MLNLVIDGNRWDFLMILSFNDVLPIFLPLVLMDQLSLLD